MYIRQQSLYANTPLAARALPDAEELKLLEPLRGQSPTAPASSASSSCRRWPCCRKPAGIPRAIDWSTPRASR
ncbi:hypothetical protein WR25_02948 [Diploscapter pachys]|uniref:Uncharacterized protein n=1 Tax=Diploscapter pachys TaxID=2018661 RepID=A0A2A2M6J6_9BILA|nr:hypothetical protein WR25_02948 [Diploscapter pachys]